MKNKLLFLSFVSLLCLLGCKEKDILIAPYTPPSPSSAGGDRHVLVEELTGVKCTNCPDAARDLLNLQGSIGADKLIIVANHSAGSFSKPYTDSKYDFRSAEAQTIALFIGDYLGAPAAVRIASRNRQSPRLS